MERHPYFNLWLHSDDDLAQILNIEIVDRTTLHEWPLSCVQLLRLADDRKLIYKTQLRATTVEPEFFHSIQGDSTINPRHDTIQLPRAYLLGTLRNSVAMTFEYLEAPRLDSLQLAEEEIVEHGRRLVANIRKYPASLPVYTDISTQDKWLGVAEDTLSTLKYLVSSGKFQLITTSIIMNLSRWVYMEATLKMFQSTITLNHGDLGGDNVFITSNGYKIIDWQRPIRGPASLDLIGYLSAMGIDPVRYTDPGMIKVARFLNLRWLVECKAQWFPQGESYDHQVAELADQILQQSRYNSTQENDKRDFIIP